MIRSTCFACSVSVSIPKKTWVSVWKLIKKKLPNDLKMILEQLRKFDSMPIMAVESTLNW